jgi:hypothetical protein
MFGPNCIVVVNFDLHQLHINIKLYLHEIPTCFICQYSETKVMQFLFSLLRIKVLYMFRALLAHPQESLHKRHLVYCVRVMSVGCNR